MADLTTFFPGLHRKANKATKDKFDVSYLDEFVFPSIQTQTQTCPCSNEETIIKEDLTICTFCGQVLERPLDSTSEFRYFGADDRNGDPSRIGAPTDDRLPESSLGTIILQRGGGQAMAKIRRYHQWNSQPYKERSIMTSFQRLHLIAGNSGFSAGVVDDSKELYSRLVKLCERRGFSRDALLACCMYTALKRSGSPRRPPEVAESFHISTSTFTKAFKFFQEILAQAQQKGLLPEAFTPSRLSSTSAADYIALPLSRLMISAGERDFILEQARALASRAEKENICPENMPPSLAAGCLSYVLVKHGQISDLSVVATACEVSVATIQKCIKRLDFK